MASERIYKFYVVGDAKTGKSNLISRTTENFYDRTYMAHMGADFRKKSVKIGNKTVKCQLWALPPREKYYNTQGNEFNDADAILLTIDMTDKNWRSSADKWVSTIEKSAREHIPLVIAGTKSDDVDRVVSEQDLKGYANSIKGHLKRSIIDSIATSAKEATNTDDLIEKIATFVFKSQEAIEKTQQNELIKTSSIDQQLRKYTSGWNKFVAYIKAIFSLGIFRLGVKKQNLAEDLKKELATTDDCSKVIEKYKTLNARLVREEYMSSGPLAKRYVTPILSSEDSKIILEVNVGELGKILKGL